MNSSSLNWLAIIVATISAFALGWLWYSPAVFGKAWMTESNLTTEKIRQSNQGRIFGLAFVLTLIMCINLAMLLNDPSIRYLQGLLYGFLAGVWVFCGVAIVALFEQKKARYIFINGGYLLVCLSLMGIILGAWK